MRDTTYVDYFTRLGLSWAFDDLYPLLRTTMQGIYIREWCLNMLPD